MNTVHTLSRRGQRGMSLIEALVAFVVMALGMLGVMGVQTTLRFNSDIAKQRSEATRLAQEKMETLRGFATLTAYDDIASDSMDVVGYTTNTAYTVRTDVLGATHSKNVKVTVVWDDRQGTGQQAELSSMIAGIDPALSGVLSIAPNGSPLKNARGRHAGIPIEADMHRDRSVFSPHGNGGDIHWVFNNTTGLVTRICTGRSVVLTDGVPSVELSGCTAVTGFVVSGVVRFDTDGQVSAAEAENPVDSPAFDLDLTLADAQCLDAPTPPTSAIAVRYHCLVLTPGDDAHWSGTLNVVLGGGRTLGPTAEQFRICRYTGDYDRSQRIENLEHPLAYADVTGPLTDQNFLVIRGDNSCPTDNPADPAQGDFVNSNTREQAPNPAS